MHLDLSYTGLCWMSDTIMTFMTKMYIYLHTHINHLTVTVHTWAG